MDNKKVLGNRINAALALRNKKQKELAHAIGVTDNTISYFCSGKRVPNFEQIIAIAKELNVSTDYLLGLSPVPSNNADIQAIGEKTGLTVAAIERVQQIKEMWPEYSLVLSIFLENFNLEYYLCLLYNRFLCSAREYNVPPITKQEDGVWHIKNAHEFHDSINKSEVDILFDNVHLHAKKKTLLDSMITTALLADIKEMAETFLKRRNEKGEEITNGQH